MEVCNYAKHSANEIASLINNQIDSHEKIQGYLLKAEALTHIALSGDFLDHDFIFKDSVCIPG